MKFITSSLLVLTVGLMPLAICGCKSETSANVNSSSGVKPSVEDEPAFDGRLLEIAAGYKKYALIDGKMNWAPGFCAAPGGPLEPIVSRSEDLDSHGRKLYYLLAAKRIPYLFAQQRENPNGQVIVKESWLPEEVDPKMARNFVRHASGQQVSPYATRDGKLYKASRQGDLFVMFKTDPKTPGTDNGWVYGTLTPDGKTVTSSGRVQSCMECHQRAGKDRLFGPKKPPPALKDNESFPTGDGPFPF